MCRTALSLVLQPRGVYWRGQQLLRGAGAQLTHSLFIFAKIHFESRTRPPCKFWPLVYCRVSFAKVHLGAEHARTTCISSSSNWWSSYFDERCRDVWVLPAGHLFHSKPGEIFIFSYIPRARSNSSPHRRRVFAPHHPEEYMKIYESDASFFGNFLSFHRREIECDVNDKQHQLIEQQYSTLLDTLPHSIQE